MDMSIYLNGTRLANYSSFKRQHDVNESNNETLAGTLSTDFRNIRRIWIANWDIMKVADFNIIYAFFLAQYSTGYYPVLRVPAYSLNVPAKLEISDEDIKWNGEFKKGFSIKLLEQYAFS